MIIDVNNNILGFNELSLEAVRIGVARRVRLRRLEMDLTQKGMALRASIPLATYRRFEECGEISLSNLILISVVLGMTDEIEKIFSERRYRDINDVINAGKTRNRKRGRKND